MERKNLEAGKKAAEALAPDPIANQPEAPIISEEEAQIIESPDHDEDASLPADIRRRQVDTDSKASTGGLTITPKD